MFSDRIVHFYKSLQLQVSPGEGIEVLNPYREIEVLRVCRSFYDKFYSDKKGRRLILGINPGRFGAGVTGIPFTDPIRLEKECGIINSFVKKPELSSVFVYSIINDMGGPEHFFSHYFIGAVCPLGFVKGGKNYNYYDNPKLLKELKPFIIKSLVEQIGCGISSRKCYCFGQGRNFEYLQFINKELKIFSAIVPLPHPRWVMQYNRSSLEKLKQEIVRSLYK